MATIRTLHNSENTLNYVGTLSFLCAISCTIIMLRFRSFKATFNISKNKPSNLVNYDDSPGVSLTGAYRTNKDEFIGYIEYPNPPKKITPSMVILPASQSGHRKDISKSTNNLAQPLNENVNISKSTPNIPEAVPEPLPRTEIKKQKELEKKHLDEQKKQAKLAAKEQKKAEKVKISQSTPNISEVVPEPLTRTQTKEQKKLEKKHSEEQKKQANLAAKEQEKAEKVDISQGSKNISEVVPESLTRTQTKEQKKLEKKHSEEQKKQAKLAAKEQGKADKVDISQNTKNISEVVPEPLTRTQTKEQKKLEKKHSDEQKKQAKLAAKEQEKAEKVRKEREKQMQKTKTEEKKKSRREAPLHPQRENVQAKPEIATRAERPHSTNTLESSISTSSGPPPYSPKDIVQENKTSDHSSNITLAVEESSWDLVSQHRQQISRPQVVKSIPKQTHLDLNYNVGPKNATDNSDV